MNNGTNYYLDDETWRIPRDVLYSTPQPTDSGNKKVEPKFAGTTKTEPVDYANSTNATLPRMVEPVLSGSTTPQFTFTRAKEIYDEVVGKPNGPIGVLNSIEECRDRLLKAYLRDIPYAKAMKILMDHSTGTFKGFWFKGTEQEVLAEVNLDRMMKEGESWKKVLLPYIVECIEIGVMTEERIPEELKEIYKEYKDNEEERTKMLATGLVFWACAGFINIDIEKSSKAYLYLPNSAAWKKIEEEMKTKDFSEVSKIFYSNNIPKEYLKYVIDNTQSK